ncbi:IS30 family transposase [Agromyces sp. MMS24-K17]|uniref:IS30 family transposase n=1 Tax=Agromyces sp. MMS24-K17 TaxID=3372850 RepID=UPI0037549C29
MAFSSIQENELWRRWRAGDSTRLIARSLGCSPRTVHAYLGRTGGVRPPKRRRSESHLTVLEREDVSRGIAAGLSARAIAARLHRAPSTISREIHRNGGREAYRAVTADEAAMHRARRPKTTRLAADPVLLAEVRSKLELDWSPEQIAAWLRRQHPSDPKRWISHESIYRTIYITARRELDATTARHLRSGRSVRRPRLVQSSHGRGRLRNMTPIHARPVEVHERTVLGHWEGDLVMGRRPSAVATLVERQTRFVRIVPLPHGYKADAVRRAIVENLRAVPPTLRLSLTWDRGREMAEHQELAVELGLQVYFCDARSPWQRGSNENTNRLLRQYLAKGEDLNRFSLRQLDDIAERINTRPRRVLGWDTAADRFRPELRRAHQPT